LLVVWPWLAKVARKIIEQGKNTFLIIRNSFSMANIPAILRENSHIISIRRHFSRRVAEPATEYKRKVREITYNMHKWTSFNPNPRLSISKQKNGWWGPWGDASFSAQPSKSSP
jgi:hypothetical protein